MIEKPDAEAFRHAIQMWKTRLVKRPTFGEYPVYDEHLYQYMIDDRIRMNAYEAVIRKVVPGKIVVEIGTGAQAPLALMCARAGAQKVYAIESNQSAVRAARQLVRQFGFENIIEVIEGKSTELDLPVKMDVCVSEIIGMIGSAEGVIPILDDARRFLKPGGVMIPERCETKMVPVTHPDEVFHDETLDRVHQYYLDRIHSVFGSPIRFSRFAFFNFPESNFLAKARDMEAMDFDKVVQLPRTHTVQFEIERSGRCDGLLFWIRLCVDSEHVISGWRNTSWAPVFIDLSSFWLEKGDALRVTTTTKSAAKLCNPDYLFEVTGFRDGKIIHVDKVESKYADLDLEVHGATT